MDYRGIGGGVSDSSHTGEVANGEVKVKEQAGPEATGPVQPGGKDVEPTGPVARPTLPPDDGLDVVVRLSDVPIRAVEWIWPGWLPRGAITILDGDPGEGKSQLALRIAAQVSTGLPFPGEAPGLRLPSNVLLLSAEDDPAATIAPRLKAAGADLTRVELWTGVWNKEATSLRFPKFPEDAPRLERIIKEDGIELVVIDPLAAYVSRGHDTNCDQDMRDLLANVYRVAKEEGAAVLFLRHLNKQAGGKTMYRGGGSIGIIGQARVAMQLGRKRGLNPDERVLSQVKNNLTKEKPPMLIEIVEDSETVSHVEWLGETSIRLEGKAPKSLIINVFNNNGGPTSTANAPKPSAADRLLKAVREAAGPVPYSGAMRKLKLNGVTMKKAVDRLVGEGRLMVNESGLGRTIQIR
jgi:hypothetical protein